MFRKIMVVNLIFLFSLTLLMVNASSAVNPDDVLVRYPDGFTRLLVADLATLANNPVLTEGFLDPLAAARHPLNGIRQIVEDTLELNAGLTSFVAHGTGPGMTGVSLIQGLPLEAAFGPLIGLQFAVGVPMSPFTNWELQDSNGLPLIRAGGVFGPVQIQWGYAFDFVGDALWVGTETSFGPPANVEKLEATMGDITALIQGDGDFFDELLIALGARGGDVSFVRTTDASVDRPTSAGEQALGLAMSFTESGAVVNFDVRFNSSADAAAALADLNAGTSPYLAQDLYQGELLNARQQGPEILFSVSTTLSAAVGLVILVMPQ